jgi:hypothetical protein
MVRLNMDVVGPVRPCEAVESTVGLIITGINPHLRKWLRPRNGVRSIRNMPN